MDQEVKYISIIDAWNELQKVENNIDLLETKLSTRLNIKASKLKEILVQSSIKDNDKFVNSIIAKDEDVVTLYQLYNERSGYELFIHNEIKRLRVSDLELCIIFLKEYQQLTWDKIEKEIHYSKRKCKQVYYDYRDRVEGKVWHIDDKKLPVK